VCVSVTPTIILYSGLDVVRAISKTRGEALTAFYSRIRGIVAKVGRPSSYETEESNVDVFVKYGNIRQL
jgi:hypothetical protein